MEGVLQLLSAWLCVDLSLAFYHEHSKYANVWIAEIEGGGGVAEMVARDLGYTYRGKVGMIVILAISLHSFVILLSKKLNHNKMFNLRWNIYELL